MRENDERPAESGATHLMRPTTRHAYEYEAMDAHTRRNTAPLHRSVHRSLEKCREIMATLKALADERDSDIFS